MATFEATRDMRSAARDPMREKERSAKWSRGVQSSEGQLAKVRPRKAIVNYHTPSHNIVKPKMSWNMPPNHARAKINVMEELNDPASSRSLVDIISGPDFPRDRDTIPDSPWERVETGFTVGETSILGHFFKANPRETEKFVEKEYEILDNNGDALKGRKARRNLRQQSQSPASIEEPQIDEDGFELIPSKID